MIYLNKKGFLGKLLKKPLFLFVLWYNNPINVSGGAYADITGTIK